MSESILKPKRVTPDEFKLNIVPLVDVLTNILIFLLININLHDQNITLAKDVTLPESTAQLDFKKAVNISIGISGLFVEDREILKLNDGTIPPEFLEEEKVAPLFKVMTRLKPIIEKRRVTGVTENSTVVLLQADKKVKYKTINQVIRTAGMAGFPNFRFAVMKKD